MKNLEINIETQLLEDNKDYTIYNIGNKENFVIVYHVFSGIEVTYSNLRINRLKLKRTKGSNILTLCHCKKGRLQFTNSKGKSTCFKEMDLSLYLGTKNGELNILADNYYGVSVNYYLDQIDADVINDFFHIKSSLADITHKISKNTDIIRINSEIKIKQIFMELYNIPDVIKLDYLRLKVLELLSILKTVNIKSDIHKNKTYNKKQILKIQEIESYIIENIDQHNTLKQLSDKFQIPLTTMKTCFKDFYGVPIYMYIKRYRIQMASNILRDATYQGSIADIALKVGYENPSKFSAAFKENIGYTPKEYRKMR